MNTLILHNIHVFLASSNELEEDRKEITELINQLNEVIYEPEGIRIKLDKWERQNPAFKGERSQNEYDGLVRNSKLFIVLFHHFANRYTLEEFNVAQETCMCKGFPHICIYYKALLPGDKEEESLLAFKKRVTEQLEYFTIPPYAHIDTLRYSVMMQLAHLHNNNDLKAEIKGSQLMLGKVRIGNLDNISFSGNNAEVIRIKQEIEENATLLEEEKVEICKLQERISKCHKKIERYKDDEEALADYQEDLSDFEEKLKIEQNKYTQLQIKQNNLKKQLEEQNNRLLDIAIQISQISSQNTSELLKQASQLFEKGDSQGAAALLNLKKIEPDINRSLQEYQQAQALVDTTKKALETNIEVLLLSAKSTLADLKNPDRFNDACKTREKALEIARICSEHKTHAHYVYKYARFLDKNHKSKRALFYYKCAIQLYAALLSENQDDDLEILEIIARCHNLMGNIYNRRGDFTEAEKRYLMLLEMYQQLHSKAPAYDFDCKQLLVKSNLGVLYYKYANKEKGQQLIEEAVNYYDQLPEEKKIKYRSDVAHCWINLGCFYKEDTRRHRKARTFLQKALDCYLQLHAQNPSKYASKVADCYHNLGNLRTDNDWIHGETSLLKALEIRYALAETKPEIHLPEVASTLRSLGWYYQNQALKIEKQKEKATIESTIKELKEKAILNYKKSVSIRKLLESDELQEMQKSFGVYTPIIAYTQDTIAQLYIETGQYKEAIEQYTDSIKYNEKLAEANTAYYLSIIEAERQIGFINEVAFNNWEEALHRYHSALNIAKQYFASHEEIIACLKLQINNIKQKQISIPSLSSSFLNYVRNN